MERGTLPESDRTAYVVRCQGYFVTIDRSLLGCPGTEIYSASSTNSPKRRSLLFYPEI